MKEPFSNHMKQLFEQVIEQFSDILQEKRLKKNQLIHHENEFCDELFLVKSGVLRAFYHLDGKDVTAHFATANDSITAPDSFVTGKRSKYNIEALQESEVYSVRNDDLEAYLLENPHLERLARQFTQHIYMELLERVEQLVFFSAADRYAQLLRDKPNIIQLVSLGHIASYLGITQETLSRVRSQVKIQS